MKPRFILFILCMFYCTSMLNGQVAINAEGAPPDSSSILDISSLNKGVLIPRTDTATVNAYSNPSIGLLIFQTSDSTFYYYDGKWKGLSTIENALDNLGDHIAIENIQTNGFYLSNNGEDKGIYIDENGKIGIGMNNPTAILEIPIGSDESNTLKIINNLAQDNIESIQTSWQSYTATIDGELGMINIPSAGFASRILTITIYAGEGISGTVLGTITANDIYDFTSLNIPQLSGETYTFSFSIASGEFDPYTNSDYDGGISSFGPSKDIAFDLYINPSLSGSFKVGEDGISINNYSFPLSDGQTNQILQTNGEGSISWIDQPMYVDTDDQIIDTFRLENKTLEISLFDDGQSVKTLDLSSITQNISPNDLFPQLPEPNFSCFGIVTNITLGYNPKSVAIGNGFAYVVDSNSEDLKIIDIKEKNKPSIISSLPIGNIPNEIILFENYVYVVDQGSEDLKIINISDPTSPNIVSTITTGESPQSIDVDGDYAYVVDDDDENIKIIDISDKNSPIVTGILPFDGAEEPVAVAVSGNYAYAYIEDLTPAELKIIDISNKNNPVIISSLTTGNEPVDVKVSGDYAFLINKNDKLRIVDVSDASNPFIVSISDIGMGESTSLEVSGNYAYVTTDDFVVIDISDKSNPSVINSVEIDNDPTWTAVSDNFAYVTDNASDDLKIIQLYCTNQLTIDAGTGEFSTFIDEDNQCIDHLSLENGILSISLENDGQNDQTVDLASIDTDDQTINKLELDGSNLKISLEGDGQSDVTVDLSPLISGLAGQVPIGTIQMWPTPSPPTNWLICNGTSFSASIHPELEAVLGTTTLPNFKGRFPLGTGDSETNGSISHGTSINRWRRKGYTFRS